MAQAKGIRFQRGWEFPKYVTEFIGEKIDGKYSLNVCAGQSKLGDVKVDMAPQHRDVIKADMYNLPFPDNTFEIVVCDPPWGIVGNQNRRPKLVRELQRVLQVGGMLWFNAPFYPRSKGLRVAKIWISNPNSIMNVGVWFETVKDSNWNGNPTCSATLTRRKKAIRKRLTSLDVFVGPAPRSGESAEAHSKS